MQGSVQSSGEDLSSLLIGFPTRATGVRQLLLTYFFGHPCA